MNRLLWSTGLLTVAVGFFSPAGAQFHPSPVPWQAVVDAMGRGTEPEHAEVHSLMEPLQFRRKPWQVALTVENTDPAKGAFCHGAMVAKGWLMTAASCVCSMRQGHQAIDVILVPQTGSQPARRVAIKSEASANTVWLFQDSPLASPRVCLPQGMHPPAGTPATSFDLALVHLGSDASVPAAPGSPRGELTLIGTTPTHSLVATLAAVPASTPRRSIEVESVVIAKRKAVTPAREPYLVVADFVLKVAASVNDKCDGSTTTLTTSITPAGKHVCGSLADLGDFQSTPGTPVVMADHKEPLLMGIRGLDTYTPMTARARPAASAPVGNAPTVAMTAQQLMDAVDAGNKGGTHNWKPMHAHVGAGTAACSNVIHRWQFSNVDVFQLNGYPTSSPYRRAFIYRTNNLTAVARGAPNAYHPKDDSIALDIRAHANFDADWSSHLLAEPLDKTKPRIQRSRDPYPGYLVSITDLMDKFTYPRETDPRRYVNGNEIPYIVVNKEWELLPFADKVRPGNFIMAKSLVTRNNQVSDGRIWGGLIAHGGADALGGISLQLGRRLATQPSQQFDAKLGVAPAMDVMVMVFPNTGINNFRHLTEDAINKEAQRQLELANGWPDVKCLVRPQ